MDKRGKTTEPLNKYTPQVGGARPEAKPPTDSIAAAVQQLVSGRPRPAKLAPGVSATSPATVAEQKRQLSTWRNDALGRLHDLLGEPALTPAGKKNGKKQIGRLDISPVRTHVAVPHAERETMTPLIKRLIDASADASIDLAIAHARANEWSKVAANARAAVELRRDTAARAGVPIRASARAHGLEALATYMIEGNSPRLRSYLNDAIRNGAGTDGLRGMYARLLLMSGHYQEARRAIDGMQRKVSATVTLEQILDPDRGATWIKYPCNYYTYRYSLVTNDQILSFRTQAAVANDPRFDRYLQAMECHRVWNDANTAFANADYLLAVRTYLEAGNKIDAYFRQYHGTADPDQLLLYGRGGAVGAILSTNFRRRYGAMTLEELHDIDWQRPLVAPAGVRFYDGPVATDWTDKVVEKIDAPLATMRFVFIPLAIAEASKARRRYTDSSDDPGLGTMAGAQSSVSQAIEMHARYKVMCEFIERPFAAILKGQILLLKADAYYRSIGQLSDPNVVVDGREAYRNEMATKLYQGVLDHFTSSGNGLYRTNAAAGATAIRSDVTRLVALAQHPTARALQERLRARGVLAADIAPPASPADRQSFARLGVDPQIPSLVSANRELIGLARQRAPLERLIEFRGNGTIPRESNPAIYAIILEATLRIRQLGAGFNYLGYRDDYVPPWRFTYLLDRARYFVTHAAQVQNAYLTFLGNAEREYLQEQSANQNAAIERANVALESRRLDAAQAQLSASQAGVQLAALKAVDAQSRLDRYRRFDDRMDDLTNQYLIAVGAHALFAAGPVAIGMMATGVGVGATVGGVAGAAIGTLLEVGGGTVVGGAIGVAVGGVAGLGAGLLFGGGEAISEFAMQYIQKEMENEQRELEKDNLKLAVGEAQEEQHVAEAQRDAAAAGVEVAAMQRAVAMMRQEFAAQTVDYLRNRTLNAELWYRLADSLRAVAERYLRYGIELSFLAEQSCEFEICRRLDVIRFDYGDSDVGLFVGGDTLLADLDSLEATYITDVKSRRQRVRYVVSMARDFPEALEELRQNGACLVTIPLRSLETRFPGMYNLRLSSMGVQPFALTDPTRFSIQATHLGESQVRIPGDQTPGTPSVTDPFAGTDLPSWCQPTDATIDADWPVKVRVTPPDTQVYAGMTRTEEVTEDRFFTENQRAPFEGLGGASTWQIDMSMRENRVNSDTLTDMLLTFNLTGYHSENLRERTLPCIPAGGVQTLDLSGRSSFADSYYQFQNAGAMTWAVDDRWLPAGMRPGRLRNLGVMLRPSSQRPTFGRVLSAYLLQLKVSAAGAITHQTAVPHLSLGITRLTLSAAVTFDGPVTSAQWNFGDDPADGPQQWVAASNTPVAHAYARAGKYTLKLRVVSGGQLTEFTAAVAVSSRKDLAPPLAVYPVAQAGVQSATAMSVTIAPSTAAGVTTYVTGAGIQASGAGGLTVSCPKNATTTLLVVIVRDLSVGMSSGQRYDPNARVPLSGLRTATNREFDATGTLTTPAATFNALTTRLMGAGELFPLDRWQLTVSTTDNPFLESVTPWDTAAIDLSEIRDAQLSIEYDTTASPI